MISHFGPYSDDEEALFAAGSAGYPLLFSDVALRVRVEDDGFVDEDYPVVWCAKHGGKDVLVCGLLVEGEERNFPGSELFKNAKDHEKRWKWPTWTTQMWVSSRPIDPAEKYSDDLLSEIFQNIAHYELTLHQEMLGLGRRGDVRITVQCPPSAKALAAVEKTIRRSSPPY